MAAPANMHLFQKRLEEYLRYNKREQGPLIENRAQRIRFALFRQYADIAPEAARIEQEARRSIESGRGLKRGRNKRGKRLTIAQEIRRRKGSRKYLASSFITKGWRTNRTGQTGQFKSTSRRGRTIGTAKVKTQVGVRNPSVELSSFLIGAGRMNDERRLVDKAVAAQIGDMEQYVARKQREAFKRMIGRSLVRV